MATFRGVTTAPAHPTMLEGGGGTLEGGIVVTSFRGLAGHRSGSPTLSADSSYSPLKYVLASSSSFDVHLIQ
jgi:hypothetical protein